MARQLFIGLTWLIALCLGLSGCAASPAGPPVVTVITPLEGARIGVNERLRVNAAAAASSNVSRLELRIAGVTVASAVNPTPSPTFSSILEYTPNVSGTLQLAVVAFNGAGQPSEPYLVNLQVGEESLFSLPQPPGEASAATPTPLPGVVGNNGCTLNATFVTDVNVPDFTEFKPAANFIKTWRIKNTSTCAWEGGYQLAFLADEVMGALPVMPVPPVAKDAEVDLSVSFTAPKTAGVYTSTWRLREPGGKSFGNRVYVVIKVTEP